MEEMTSGPEEIIQDVEAVVEAHNDKTRRISVFMSDAIHGRHDFGILFFDGHVQWYRNLPEDVLETLVSRLTAATGFQETIGSS